MYVGLYMLARVQAEEKVDVINSIAKKSKFIRRLIKEERQSLKLLEQAENNDTEGTYLTCVYFGLKMCSH